MLTGSAVRQPQEVHHSPVQVDDAVLVAAQQVRILAEVSRVRDHEPISIEFSQKLLDRHVRLPRLQLEVVGYDLDRTTGWNKSYSEMQVSYKRLSLQSL